MKRLTICFWAILCAIAIFPSNAWGGDIKLDKDTLWIHVGESDTIRANSDENAAIMWDYPTALPRILNVSGRTGNTFASVYGVRKGTVKVVAMSSMNGPSDTCTVIVLSAVMADSIALNHDTIDMAIGDTMDLRASVFPLDVTNKLVTWADSGDQVIDFVPVMPAIPGDTVARFVAAREGQSIITASINGLQTQCVINVKKVSSNGIHINKDSLLLSITDTASLSATIEPLNATNKQFYWTVSNDSILHVDAQGLVTALSEGTAWVIATAQDGGYTDSCKVVVFKASPDAIATVENCSIYAFDNTLRVQSEKPAMLRIYTIAGALYREMNDISGEQSIVLPRGIYIVTLGTMSKKILIP